MYRTRDQLFFPCWHAASCERYSPCLLAASAMEMPTCGSLGTKPLCVIPQNSDLGPDDYALATEGQGDNF